MLPGFTADKACHAVQQLGSTKQNVHDPKSEFNQFGAAPENFACWMTDESKNSLAFCRLDEYRIERNIKGLDLADTRVCQS